MRAVVSLLVLAALAFTSRAEANWAWTRWGMSPAEVIAASNGTAHLAPPPPPRADVFVVGYPREDVKVVGSYTDDGVTFAAEFRFDPGLGLLSVALSAPAGQLCVAYVARREGPAEGGPSHSSSHRWTTAKGDWIIVSERADASCRIDQRSADNAWPPPNLTSCPDRVEAAVCAQQVDRMRLFTHPEDKLPCARVLRSFDICFDPPDEAQGVGLLLDQVSLPDGPDGDKVVLHFANTLHKNGDGRQRECLATAEIREFPNFEPDDTYEAKVAALILPEMTTGRSLIGAVEKTDSGFAWREALPDGGGVAWHHVTIFYVDRTIDLPVNHTRAAIVGRVQIFGSAADVTDSDAARFSIYPVGAP